MNLFLALALLAGNPFAFNKPAKLAPTPLVETKRVAVTPPKLSCPSPAACPGATCNRTDCCCEECPPRIELKVKPVTIEVPVPQAPVPKAPPSPQVYSMYSPIDRHAWTHTDPVWLRTFVTQRNQIVHPAYFGGCAGGRCGR